MIRSIIVDDERISIRVLEKMLESCDFIDNAASCQTAEAAMTAFARIRPEAAFVDINMPGKNGIELAGAFQSIRPDVKIIFVTADESHAVKAFEMVAFDYLVKPVELERFQRLIDRLSLVDAADSGATGDLHASAIRERSENKPVFNPVLNSVARINSQLPDAAGRVSVLTMGGFELKTADDQTVKWRSEKTRELFALLYHNRGRNLSRNMLIDTLWPDHDPVRAQHLLHNGIYYIRKALRDNGIDKQHILIDSGYKLMLKDVFADNFCFEQAAARSYIDLETHVLESYDRLYHGPYMDFESWTWCELDRIEMEKNYDRLLLVLTDRYESAGRRDDLEMILIKRSRRDPYNESLAARLIIFYEMSGNQQKALDYRVEFERKMREDIWNQHNNVPN
jgi:two-component SAPR family response regulator